MFRAVLGGAALFSGSYVLYRVLDHPVVRADAAVLLKREQYDLQTNRDVESTSLEGLRKWTSVFSKKRIFMKKLATKDSQMLETTQKRSQFREQREQGYCPLGSFCDTPQSKVLRFAIPLQNDHQVPDGIFTVKHAPQANLVNQEHISLIGKIIHQIVFGSRSLLEAFVTMCKYCCAVPMKLQHNIVRKSAYNRVEDVKISVHGEFFPLFGTPADHFFDLHVWDSVKTEDFFYDYDNKHALTLNLSQKITPNCICSYERLIFIADPFGVSAAVQLLDWLTRLMHGKRSEQMNPINIHILYVKPPQWAGITLPEQRLRTKVDDRKTLFPSSRTDMQEIVGDYRGEIHRELTKSSESTLLVAAVSKESMQSLKEFALESSLKDCDDWHILRITLD